MRLLCFDVGATLIKSALVDDKLNVKEIESVKTPFDSFESFLGVIEERYRRCSSEVAGIAFAMPGFIDTQNGLYYGAGVFRYPHQPDIARQIAERCGCKVVIDNDGKAAALAEFHQGALQGCQNACVFVIGTGVGGGLIIDSKIVRGPHFSAGEFSFLNTEASRHDDLSCIVGSKCSTTFLLQSYRERSERHEMIDGIEFFKRLETDQIAREILDELCENIAVQLYNLYWLLDLQKIAIGGGISRQPLLIAKIREKFAEIRKTSLAGIAHHPLSLTIVPCRFYNEANLIGAFISYQNNQQLPV